MAERTVELASAHGLHARPATLFTQAVAKSGVPVTIAKGDGKAVNAASILGVISLGIEQGDTVTLASDAPSSDALLDELVTLLATDMDAQ
ncbi:HPr family phosphocarrier protein [Herbiconiux sp. KACC 21604]|uniref:HPr family phosphocarrier protein n=1 Tax=unclassified Herbiconiux TaxID=2618217 RepID=UPI0014908AD4|nr:HPr family phosphocarrier protein [Herbiconiux sp. SALV-R1]QJU52418.1 HPr family phosphocarrier protein [Herbiconiux sp. SALV-R1]WPO87282.1 HPr family phosphocarrier protein [Herbiconiux sp. KACC 21604]